jgi:uncharacterized protein YgbK (DUF1537 family)
MPISLGAIADDFTGAADLAVLIRRSGMSVSLLVGVPAALPESLPDAIVIALKTRTVAPEDAVRQSLDAARWLRWQAGAQRLFFKYCSTFDSTDRGNIGPVIDALMAEFSVPRSIAVPAFPENGRRMFAGHLFVNGRLLSESSMATHPLTPMHDADIVRVLGRQRSGAVGLIDKQLVDAGPEAMRATFDAAALGTVFACDAIGNDDLAQLAIAFADLPLATGGSAIGAALARQWFDPATGSRLAFGWPAPGTARVLAISGSGSEMTRRQVARALRQGYSGIRVTADEASDPAGLCRRVLAEFARHRDERCLVYATDTPAEVLRMQERLGRQKAGALLETFFGILAKAARDSGYDSLIVAGGETSGAVVQALGVTEMIVGPEIAPGVPWLRSGKLWLALKSGNFGAESFFDDARHMLAGKAIAS